MESASGSEGALSAAGWSAVRPEAGGAQRAACGIDALLFLAPSPVGGNR